MVISFLTLIFILGIWFHFQPRYEKGYLTYNENGRRCKKRKRCKMKKHIDRFLTLLSIMIFSIVAIYTCGFFVFYAGYRDNDEDTMVFGGMLSAVNAVIIFATLKCLPL